MTDPCRKALEKVVKAAEATLEAPDATAALQALNPLYFALQDAQKILIDAQAEAKVAAWLASMEKAA